eukprot:5500263-Pyramimonas_sp.AAC.1
MRRPTPAPRSNCAGAPPAPAEAAAPAHVLASAPCRRRSTSPMGPPAAEAAALDRPREGVPAARRRLAD